MEHPHLNNTTTSSILLHSTISNSRVMVVRSMPSAHNSINPTPMRPRQATTAVQPSNTAPQQPLGSIHQHPAKKAIAV